MFGEPQSRPVLEYVCRQLGIDPRRAVLLRHHTNGVYAVDDAVIKIAPRGSDIERLRTVVTMVGWLARLHFPTAMLYPGLAQPLQVDGHPVTIWQRMDTQAQPVTIAELGRLLKQLHSLDPPADVALPHLDPPTNIHHSITVSAMLNEDDRRMLLDHLEHLKSFWAKSGLTLGRRLIQSDPQVANALRDPRTGQAVLSDWDGICIGPPEWDIATVAVHCTRFGKHRFGEFASAYGWHDEGRDFATLCRFRELQMIATNARKSAPGTPAASQVLHRINDLRKSTQSTWTIL